ncbi:hypothetical protein K2173_012722 [Erythroxylum novogranatense]|uniref:non-specific serine/threonine protein kinase n=1 Tax=Erythroxylum novogranatense TaxID=1862640 RepID=A0AAV8U528_9ROSI|nr:hypothetical protein K2173_012722 [Erythroxylum novogranatense]
MDRVMCLVFILMAFQLPLCFSFLPGNETDRLSLLAIKDQIEHDPFGRLKSWNESSHFCHWFGVTCGRKHQRVVQLNFTVWELAGRLAPDIGNMSFLRVINLQNNSFSHHIPPELGLLFRLQRLRLRNNKFIGEIPMNVSRCSNLQELDVTNNNLTGNLPAELGILSNLRVLFIEKNHLFGEIPSSLANISFLEGIYGAYNNFQGDIPERFGQLRSLKTFALGVNNLSGCIPTSMYNISSLTAIDVALNQLRGSLPHNLGETLPNLVSLGLGVNHFTGMIPSSLSNASNLNYFDIGTNKFAGRLPTFARQQYLQLLQVSANNLGNGEDDDLNFLYSLANNTVLEVLVIGDNNFGGIMPQIVGNFSTKLWFMDFHGNQIRGIIPTEIGNLISLEFLIFEENHLTGCIPNSVGKLENLYGLYLTGNELSGSIPSTLGNVTSLNRLYLGWNKLQGSIPSSLGDCRHLVHLILYKNKLNGPIPKVVFGISSLTIYLGLSYNEFEGTLPSEVGQLEMLGGLDVSNNRLSGEIPESLGKCKSLESLYMQGNLFHGKIPESLGSLRAIQYLNLSHNNFTGQIPEYLGHLRLLEGLDLSFNDLEGEVPVQGVFENATAVSLAGNQKLCGGIPQLNLSRCTLGKPKSSSKVKLTTAIACGILGLMFTISFAIFWWLRKGKTLAVSRSSMNIPFHQVTYQDLLKATAGFSESKLIGAGSFGTVYKGILERDQEVVAVKVLNLLNKGASKSFMVECEALKNIRHRNLVKVVTACSSIDFQGNDFKALVYEYMVNGSLEEWLHSTDKTVGMQELKSLNLIQRLSIAIDVASALDYLHHHCETPIIHRDLKPSNVMLDANMNARVGDFGLARLLHDTSTQVAPNSNQSSTSGIRGTIGYIAPEYGMRSEVTIYGDVYSYGIMLLELFTGKKPTDTMFNEELNLHNFVKMALPNHVAEIVDSKILEEGQEPSANATERMRNNVGNHKIMECLIAILEIGVACSAKMPEERLNMSNVTVQLQKSRDILLGTGVHRRQGQF